MVWPPLAMQSTTHDAFLVGLSNLISKCLDCNDSNSPIFSGNYDWHSSVHAHWALLRIARALASNPQNEEVVRHAQKAVTRLDPEKLQLELEQLQRNTSFEMPYGRAWFLKLAVELQLYSTQFPSLVAKETLETMSAFAKYVASNLHDFLQRRRCDTSASTQSKHTEGEYDSLSWSLLRLHEYYQATNDTIGISQSRELIRDYIFHPPEYLQHSNVFSSFERDSTTATFFSAYGNWVHLLCCAGMVIPELKTFLEAHPLISSGAATTAEDILTAVPPLEVLPVYVHHLSMNWSRAWALASLASAGSEVIGYEVCRGCAEAYERHIREGIALHHRLLMSEMYSEKYTRYFAYDHWVPQFAVYALTEHKYRYVRSFLGESLWHPLVSTREQLEI